MFIFNQVFTAKSKKSGNPFYQVRLFEKRVAQDDSVYFKDLSLFVEKDVYDSIIKQNFNFGDIVDVEKTAPAYFGGTEQLAGLTLVAQSPYFD